MGQGRRVRGGEKNEFVTFPFFLSLKEWKLMFRLSRKIPSSSFNQETHLGLSLSFAQDVAPANQTTRFEEVDPLSFYYSLT